MENDFSWMREREVKSVTVPKSSIIFFLKFSKYFTDNIHSIICHVREK